MVRKIKKKIIFKLIDLYNQYADDFVDYKNKKSCSCSLNSRFYRYSAVDNFCQINKNIVVGERTHIRGQLLTFSFGGNINIGSNCYIGENTRVWSGEHIIIGNNVLISHNVNIMDTNSHEINHLERAEGFEKLIKYGHQKEKGSILTAPVIIEDYAWISFNASILKGVKIGKGAIIGAGSVVTKDVEPFTLAAGNPAKFIMYLNEKRS